MQVYPSPSRPHYLKAGGIVGASIGGTDPDIDASLDELIAELRRSSLGKSFDEQALPALDSEAVDFRAASECFASTRKLKRSNMETLRLVVPHQGRKVPSVGGILLFGRDREVHFPDAWIQAGRFGGVDKGEIVDTAALHGALPTLVEAAIGYAQRGAPIRISIFDDRVEIENPGLLPPGLTVEDLRRGVSKLRNRVIGRVFQELGLIEQWGSGIQRMSAACRDAGLPTPMLEEIGTRFRVTLHTTQGQVPPLDNIDQAILDALSDGSGRSTNEIATHIERTPRAARTRLASLVERGFVREIGSSPQDPKRRYFKAVQNLE